MSENKVPVDLINRICCLFVDNMCCINNWGFYLFNSDFDKEPELRNKVGAIWIASLFDSLAAELRYLEKLKDEASELEQDNIVNICEQAGRFFDSVKEILALYSKEEQIFIRDLRDQLVHSSLSNRLRSEVNIKYFEGGKLFNETIPSKKYSEILQPMYELGTDRAMMPLVDRFRASKLKDNLRYWRVQEEFFHMDLIKEMQTSMQSGQKVEIKSLLQSE